MITSSNKYLLMTNSYKNLNILKLADVDKMEVASKYMHQLRNNKLPKSPYDDCVKINKTHNYDTRQIKNKVYFKPRLNKTVEKKC